MIEFSAVSDAERLGMWLHPGTPKSPRFVCSLCGGVVYYHQAHRKQDEDRERLVMPYEHCPYCMGKMQTYK